MIHAATVCLLCVVPSLAVPLLRPPLAMPYLAHFMDRFMCHRGSELQDHGPSVPSRSRQ